MVNLLVRAFSLRRRLTPRAKQAVGRVLSKQVRRRLAQVLYTFEAGVVVRQARAVSVPQRLIDEALDPADFERKLQTLRRAAPAGERSRLDAVLFENVLQRQDHALLQRFYNEVLRHTPDPGLHLEKAEAEFILGNFAEAARTLQGVDENALKLTHDRRTEVGLMRGMTRLLDKYPAQAPAKERSGSPFYLLHFALPLASNGYATRSHALLRALKKLGQPVRPITMRREASVKADETGPATIERDDVSYSIVRSPIVPLWEEDLDVANFLSGVFAAQGEGAPSVIHAASNYQTGLAGLLAARTFGVPFIYEVRGLWEVTRSSLEPEFTQMRRFHFQKAMETFVARSADAVLALNAGLRNELIRRGVDASKIHLAPNGVDSDRFRIRDRNQELRRSLGLSEEDVLLGYIGSIVEYEGLDDLLYAVALLKDRPIKAIIVGSGDEAAPLRRLAEKLGILDRVIFTGRVPHEAVEEYYAALDIAVFPRKPLVVCEMVTPVKPFEALAMGKTIVVSSVAPLAEIVQHGTTGFVFRSGSVFALKDVLEQVASLSREQREAVGRAGRAWVEMERSWANAAQVIVGLYRQLGQPKTPPSERLQA